MEKSSRYSQCIVRKTIYNQSLVAESRDTCIRKKGRQIEGKPCAVTPAKGEAREHSERVAGQTLYTAELRQRGRADSDESVVAAALDPPASKQY